MGNMTMDGRATDTTAYRRFGMTTEELREAVRNCYCGLGPACEVWRKMTPVERDACSRDKRANAQLLWKRGEWSV